MVLNKKIRMKKLQLVKILTMKQRQFVVRIVKMKTQNCSDKLLPSSKENRRRDSNVTKKRLTDWLLCRHSKKLQRSSKRSKLLRQLKLRLKNRKKKRPKKLLN